MKVTVYRITKKAWQSPAPWSPSAVLQTPNFCGNMRKFCCRGNRVWSVANLNDTVKLADLPVWCMQKSWTHLLSRPSYSQFCVQLPTFVTVATWVDRRQVLTSPLNWQTPKTDLWYQNLRSISYENRVIANTAVRGLSVVFGESGSPLLLIQPPI